MAVDSEPLYHGIRDWFDRWDAMTPEEREAYSAAAKERHDRFLQHKAFLDYCVATKTDPNLVLPIKAK